MDRFQLKEQRDRLIKNLSKDLKIKKESITPLFLAFEEGMSILKAENNDLRLKVGKSAALIKRMFIEMKVLLAERNKAAELFDKVFESLKLAKKQNDSMKIGLNEKSEAIAQKMYKKFMKENKDKLSNYGQSLAEKILENITNTIKMYDNGAGLSSKIEEKLAKNLENLKIENQELKKELQQLEEAKLSETFSGDVAAPDQLLLGGEEEPDIIEDKIDELEEGLIDNEHSEDEEEPQELQENDEGFEDVENSEEDVRQPILDNYDNSMDESSLEDDPIFVKQFLEMRNISEGASDDVIHDIMDLMNTGNKKVHTSDRQPARKVAMNESRNPIKPNIKNREISERNKQNSNPNKSNKTHSNFKDIMTESLNLMDSLT